MDLFATPFLRALERLPRGSLSLQTPDGKTYHFSGRETGAGATLELADWGVVRNLAWRGDIGFAEDYRDGRWTSRDPESLFRFALQNEESLRGYLYGSKTSQWLARALNALRRNSLKGSRRNIAAHYDLGNAFYREWLDPTMTYSAALYGQENEPLPVAQHRKYDRILSELPAPGQILEIGCGWGGFAERASQAGHPVRGITLSREQHGYARERLSGQPAEIALQDYRHQEGRFDHIVSIEMFEAVGERYWPVYFRKLKELLKHKGRAVIQTITIGEPFFERYRRKGDAIRTFIFPGGMLPTPTRFQEEAAKAGLVQGGDNLAFGQDYARTLREWRTAFLQKSDVLRGMGYDDRFQRLWRFYLDYCAAGFAERRTDVWQFTLKHG